MDGEARQHEKVQSLHRLLWCLSRSSSPGQQPRLASRKHTCNDPHNGLGSQFEDSHFDYHYIRATSQRTELHWGCLG